MVKGLETEFDRYDDSSKAMAAVQLYWAEITSYGLEARVVSLIRSHERSANLEIALRKLVDVAERSHKAKPRREYKPR